MNFTKFEENVAKPDIKNLARFSEITKTKIFAATLLLHNLPSATHPPLTSAKTFFIGVQQCYFEIKTIKQPYFSILSSLILWVKINQKQFKTTGVKARKVAFIAVKKYLFAANFM